MEGKCPAGTQGNSLGLGRGRQLWVSPLTLLGHSTHSSLHSPQACARLLQKVPSSCQEAERAAGCSAAMAGRDEGNPLW